MRRGEGEEEIDIKKILKNISLGLRNGGAAAWNRPGAASEPTSSSSPTRHSWRERRELLSLLFRFLEREEGMKKWLKKTNKPFYINVTGSVLSWTDPGEPNRFSLLSPIFFIFWFACAAHTPNISFLTSSMHFFIILHYIILLLLLSYAYLNFLFHTSWSRVLWSPFNGQNYIILQNNLVIVN